MCNGGCLSINAVPLEIKDSGLGLSRAETSDS